MKKQAEIHIFKAPKSKGSFNDSDKYYLKKMLHDVITRYYCPDCKPLRPLEWKDNSHKFMVCKKCGFEQPFVSSEEKGKP